MTAASSSTALPAFRDPQQPIATRIDDLVARLNLPEKINQLVHENNAVERLGIPAYNWWNEACHGVGRNGRATVFPQVIGLGATWNRDLVEQVATAISDEARAKHHAALAANRHGQYQGLTFWTPNINIFRDPRWGRGQETFGEDPFLTSELGLAVVHGLQGKDPRYLKVAACAKHFAVHSGPESERHEFDAQPTPKDLAETYLPAFERLVRGGVETVMGAYNRVLGEPACASKFLLGEILRRRWGFQGHVVSDCGAIDDFHHHHHITRNAMESAALAVRNGCDLNCGCTYNDLVLAVREGLITEEEINTSLRRLLATKFKLGLFDPPELVPYARTSTRIVDSPEHRALARRAATESIVLLKNTGGLLPLRRNPATLLVAGPAASNVDALIGNYAGISGQLITIIEGIAAAVDDSTILEYRAGCPMVHQPAPGLNYTFGVADVAEVTIAVLGLDPTLEGEEGDAVGSLSGGDRAVIELPEIQRAFLRELRRHSKKLVLVLTGGSAIAIPEEHELCDAVIQVWYPGCEGGRAVADVLFGAAAPSGKMPVTVPKRTADLPAFNDYRMQGRTYRFATVEPLYPFGFGLTYASFRYDPLTTSTRELRAGEALTIRTAVANESDRDALETVQCYVLPPAGWPDAPRATLVAFRKVLVSARGCTAVEFTLPADAFQQVNAAGERVWAPGAYRVVVGSASPGPRAQALGAAAPVEATLTLR
ncbi:glycoside hydrolase family 3 N-terminal domain-containing protein [Opitutus sp. ER46]|uniref:glycoside hydrolase family 3 N-terminal domain-containing protein n=1 Tax=Opitutus sp. ER46 TaxID=2161864 RepID=UPI000D31CCB7|nr:glycoside hydrolase family 3 N-terminal domain-containing protein [Opitutus sp. ER46]PTX91574.1 glycosyl hydrolase [Opitutus sp. ER46]